MSVSEQPTVNSSTGNGVTTVFPYTFKILNEADIEVTVDGVVKTLTTHYTVSGVGDDGGGDVTFLVAPANGTTVIRRRDMALVRTTDYQYQGELPTDVLNDDQDAPILMLQQVQEQVDRAIKLPLGDDTETVLPAAEDRASKALVFDEDGVLTVSADDYNDQAEEAAASAAAAGASASAASASAASAASSASSAQTIATQFGDMATAIAAAQTAETNAETAQGHAEDARDGAEDARDSLIAAASIYADTTAGLAATASGGYFWVPSTDADEAYILYRDNAGVAVEVKRLPAANLVSRIADSVTATQTIGLAAASTPVTGTVVSSATYAMAQPVLRDGRIKTIRAYAFANHTLKVRVFDKSGTTYTQSGSDTNIAMTTGVNTKAVDIAVAAGQHVGFYVDATRLSYVAGTGDDAQGWYLGAGDVTNFTDASATDTQHLQIGFDIECLALDNGMQDNVDAFAAAFDVAAGKNLFEPSLATDNFTFDYSGGSLVALAGTMAFGKIPLEPGKTYTLSMNHDLGFSAVHNFACYNAAGSYIGAANSSGGAGLVAPLPPTSQTWDGDNTITFTLPSTTTIRSIGISSQAWPSHTTADFEAVRDSIQVEESASKTDYEPYMGTTSFARLKAAHDVAAGESALSEGTNDGANLVVEKVGDNLYVRSHWETGYDLIQKVQYNKDTTSANDVIDFVGARSVDKTWLKNEIAYGRGTVLGAQVDDVAPLQFNGDSSGGGVSDVSYMGGNHGHDKLRSATAAAHGKSIEDVGSVWARSGQNWVLVKIIDANTLWFMSENQSVFPEYSFLTTLTTGAMTHVSGALNTGTITTTAVAAGQFYPSIREIEKKIDLDGVEWSEEGVRAPCTKLRIIHTYEVLNPASQITYLKARAGSAVAPDYADASISADAVRYIVHDFAANGCCTVYQAEAAKRALKLEYLCSLQAVKLTNSGSDKLKQHVARSVAQTFSGTPYDFTGLQDISSMAHTIQFDSTWWSNPASPPASTTQVVTTSGDVKKFGFTIGFTPDRGVGTPARMADEAYQPTNSTTTKKQIIRTVQRLSADHTAGAWAAGSMFEFVGYRGWTNHTAAPDFVECFWFHDGEQYVVVIDLDATVTLKAVPDTKRFAGKKMEVIEAATGGLTLHNENTVSSQGIVVSGPAKGRVVVRVG